MLLPFVFSRQPIAFERVFFWEDVVFLLGVYTVGMVAGRHLESVMNWLSNWFKVLIGVAVVTFGVLFYLHVNEINLIGFTLIRESVHYVNKLAISGVVLVIFKRLQNQPKLMTILADRAFGIYFIHFIGIYLGLVPMLPLIQNKGFYPFSVILAIPVAIGISLAFSWGFIWIFQKIFKRYSRMIIGA